VDQMLEHSIVDDLASVGDEFSLFDSVHHEGDVVDWGALWIGEVAISVRLEGTTNVPHEGSMAKSEPLDVLALNEGDHVACNDVVTCL